MKHHRMFFIFHGRFPSEKAAALFAAKSMQEFSQKGVDVIGLFPRRFNSHNVSPSKFYGLDKNIKMHFLITVDLFWVPRIKRMAFWVSFFAFSVSVFVYVFMHCRKDDLVYTNESLPALLLSFLPVKVVYEMHDFPENSILFYKSLFQRVSLVVTTNTWKSTQLKKLFNIPDQKIFVEFNAVNVDMFNPPISQIESRQILGIEEKERVCVYTGHLYKWKGVDVLAEAATLTPDVSVYFVGGTNVDVKDFQKRWGSYKNIRILGYRPHSEIPLWQRAADVLVLPNTGRENISAFYTSPMKLFEYMASGVPVIASDLPSVREITPQDSVAFVPPDNPVILAQVIRDIASGVLTVDTSLAQDWVKDHSWGKRASRLCSRLFV